MGKESKKEWIHVFLLQIHFAVHLKLTQHCKSIIPQLKKKRLKYNSYLTRVMHVKKSIIILLPLSAEKINFPSLSFLSAILSCPSDPAWYHGDVLHKRVWSLPTARQHTSTPYPLLLIATTAQQLASTPYPLLLIATTPFHSFSLRLWQYHCPLRRTAVY